MEELKYVVEDSTIAELLGVQNFTNKESAVLELVKNAFDAKALNMSIEFSKETIKISDDGCGMDREDILLHWMHVGKSNKGYEIVDKNGNKRILAGSKGVGRFALARLGEVVEVESQKEGNNSVVWKTDWGQSTIEEVKSKDFLGTKMVIQGLRDKWSEKSAQNLANYLGRTYSNDVMKINIIYENQPIQIKRYFENPKIGINYSSKIQLKYDSNKKSLSCVIDSDEFQSVALEYCEGYNIYHYNKEIDIVAELENEYFSNEVGDINDILSNIGDFDAEFYFGIEKVLAGDTEKFLYKRKMLTEKFEYGIILFRNSFSINSYEGKKDWLELGKRSRKSTAAATHPTGSWRVRENQLSGKVNIDKISNPYLKDLSNRQGLDENIYYNIFVNILLKGLTEFEYYRQAIIRLINKKNKLANEDKKKVVDKVIKNPSTLKSLTEIEENQFLIELIDYQKESQKYKKDIETTEKRYKYDVRILNVLATSGLKATSIAHELKNDRNSIDGNYEFIVKALKKYEIWESLNSFERTKYAHLNVPALLESNKYIGLKILQFMDTMLEEVEKRQFFPEEHNIKELLCNIKDNWERDYAWVFIELEIDEEMRFTIPEDILNVIFDNLILNSIQQNENMNQLRIHITIIERGNELYMKYKDNGKGLTKKYLDTPRKILEPHETSRKKGHGLGMWIVNNTLDMSGGEVINIGSDNGFYINFMVGGKL